MKNIVATGNLNGETITIKQVSKLAARKAFEQGSTVYLQSSNMYPFGVWQSVMPVNFDKDQLQSDIDVNNFSINLYSEQVEQCNITPEQWRKDLLAEYEEKLRLHQTKVINATTQFESVINNFSYYNCDKERGKYVHFYIKS